MSNEINFCAVCPMASCTRNAQCVRYANYLKAKNEEFSDANRQRCELL